MTRMGFITVLCLAAIATRTNAASIVFPGASAKNASAPLQLVFRDEPDCVKSSAFGLCEDSSMKYPEDIVREAVASSDNTVTAELTKGDELLLSPGLDNRFGGSTLDDARLVEETAVCAATESIIYPKMAKNDNNEWLFVVNSGQATQAIRVEKCVDEGKPCRGQREGGTICRQKFIYRKMIALNGAGKMSPENFRIPSCCVCYIKNNFLSERFDGKRRKPKPAESSPASSSDSVAKSRPARQAGDKPEIEVVGGETRGLSGSPLDNELNLNSRPAQGTAQQSIETEETFNPSDTIGGNPVGRFAGEIIVHSNPIVVQKKPKKSRN